jgi:hypothetical protein
MLVGRALGATNFGGHVVSQDVPISLRLMRFRHHSVEYTSLPFVAFKVRVAVRRVKIFRVLSKKGKQDAFFY